MPIFRCAPAARPLLRPARAMALLVMSLLTGAGRATDEPSSLKPDLAGLHAFSLHSQSGYENFNPGLYLHWRSGWVAGGYRNSYRRTSIYGGWLWELDDERRFSVLLGLVNGYGRRVLSVEDSAPVPLPDGSGYEFQRTVTYSKDRPVVPLIVPSVRFGLGGASSLRLSYFPDLRRGAAQVLHLSLEARL